MLLTHCFAPSPPAVPAHTCLLLLLLLPLLLACLLLQRGVGAVMSADEFAQGTIIEIEEPLPGEDYDPWQSITVLWDDDWGHLNLRSKVRRVLCCAVLCCGCRCACPESMACITAGTTYRPCHKGATCLAETHNLRGLLPPTHPPTQSHGPTHPPTLCCCLSQRLLLAPPPPQVSPWDVDTDVEERLRQEEEARKAAAAAAAAEELARQEAAAEAARQKRRQNQRARLGECSNNTLLG